MSPKPRTNLERFLDHVGELPRNPDDCWMWQGQLHPWGYGRFGWRDEGPAAHNARLTHCKHGHEFTPENTFARGEQRLCATCERARWKRLSDKRRSSNPRVSTHGTNSKYTLGCRCDACRAGHAEYQRNYMRGRRERASVSVVPP